MPVKAYSKRPVPVSVSFAAEAGVLSTLEGPVAYAQGDALATGVAGERWPIPRARFERTYLPADPGGAMGRDGLFCKRPLVVEAFQAAEPRTVALSDGRGVLAAKAGDWIVKAPDGEVWVVNDGVFRQSYERVAESAG